MVPLTDMPGPPAPPPGLGFSISHQKVELDLDFATRTFKGKTEITIQPLYKELKSIKLNCRECVIRRVAVNGRGQGSKYQEPYSRFKTYSAAGVHQHHQVKRMLAPLVRDPPDQELVVSLGKVRIEELDPFSFEAQNQMARINGGNRRESGDASILAATPVPRSGDEHDGSRFSPITVSIEFENHRNYHGIHFAGCESGDPRYPHAYSQNSPFPGSASCLFPTIDDSSSRHTWEISIRCPRTVGDALRRSRGSLVKQGSNRVRQDHKLSNGNADPKDLDIEMSDPSIDSFGFTEEELGLDMSVICSGDMTDEIIDRFDSSMKTTSFSCSSTVSPMHIGFVVGPFEHIDLAEFRETDEDNKLGQNAVPVHAFCLPGRGDEVRNTCLPLAKAIDYFTVTFGSYPFTSYKLAFVDDMVQNTVETASLSICSNRLLFSEDIIDPMDAVTRMLVHSLAAQWIGVDIVPKESTDTWAVVGIAYFITDMFLKRLCGNNEYRFRQKRYSDEVCEMDVSRPSIHSMGAILSIDSSELEFLSLKAPLVLFTLDRRLTKASGSSGLSRIISRIFLNAKVGELTNSALATATFIRICEKLGHTKLDTFFGQWVFGAGTPRFLVTQRFNKKKLVVEMLIKQTQGEQNVTRNLDTDTFMRDVKEEVSSVFAAPVQPVFTGPMTIRIHEADGTPYEHIVEIKEASTRFEIPYNTKYKRLKRSRRQKERAAANAGIEITADQDDVLLYCLGDVLQSEEEVSDWRLADWTKEDEDRMGQESYEWIRMDADFEWICKLTINMPGYMFLSQLQQDRDVVAQLESIQYMAGQREHPLISTILVRTVMDRRYFHGIRTAAAQALAKNAKDELDWIGLYHLEKTFQECFCLPDSPMTRSNDFSDRALYYIQCAIPKALASVRTHNGRTPLRVKKFLLDKLKFNDNANNEYSDCFYVATLMTALADSLIPTGDQVGYGFDMDDDEDEDARIQKAVFDEIERYRRMDEWIASYQNVYSITALECEKRLAKARKIPVNPPEFLKYTKDETFALLRIKAFECLVELGLGKNDMFLQYFLSTLGTDPSPYLRDKLMQVFGKALAIVATADKKPRENGHHQDGLIIEQEASTEGRQAELARRQTIPGALASLKEELSGREGLKQALWETIMSPNINAYQMRDLLDICTLLYDEITSLVVTLRYPRYWAVQNLGKGKVIFSRTDKVRTKPRPQLQTTTAAPLSTIKPPQLKRESHKPAGAASSVPLKLKFTQKRLSESQSPMLPSGGPVSATAPRAASPPGAGSPPEEAKKKLKLTLKLSNVS